MVVISFKDFSKKYSTKYKNKKVVIDGIEFDSIKEGNYYLELKLREKAGDIKGFRRQIKIDLLPSHKLPSGKTLRKKYKKIDFCIIHNDGRKEFIDVKSEGFKKKSRKRITETSEYGYQKHLLYHLFKIEIIEV